MAAGTERLREVITDLGGVETQAGLARALGTSRQNVSRWVTEPSFPSPAFRGEFTTLWFVAEVRDWFTGRDHGRWN